MGTSKVVAKYINNCVTCRKMRRPVEEQRMADLPADRVDTLVLIVLAPFTQNKVGRNSKGMGCCLPA